MTKRILWIDYAKCVGIILVVLGHALQGVMVSYSLPDSTNITLLYRFIYGFHMPMYFILSGIFARRWSNRSSQTAVKQKIRAIVVPYFAWSFITGTIMQLVSKYTNNGLGIRNVMLSPVIPFSEYWFLYSLFFIFIFYLLLIKANIKDKYILAIAIFLFCMSIYIGNVKIIGGISKYFVYFSIGTYLKIFVKYLEKVNIVYYVILWIGINVIYLGSSNFSDIQSLVVSFSTSILGSLAIFEACLILEKRSEIKWMSKLGQASMGIFVIHLLPLAGIRIVLKKILNVTNPELVTMISFIGALLISYITFSILKRYKFGRMIMGVK